MEKSFEFEKIDVLSEYSFALDMLDAYDHQTLTKPSGDRAVYQLSAEECEKLIRSMKFSGKSELFGKEKTTGKVESILSAVYQEVFGAEVYPTVQEKAARLLYFLVKDHPFDDGCKRIAAAVFLEYLNKNGMLIKDGKEIISSQTLTALVLLIAESQAQEAEIIIKVIMNLIS